MTARWFVVQTKPCHEAIAHGNLTAAGFEAYIPTVREEIRTKTKRLTVLAPMFPGYIFVRFDWADHDWHAIASLRGVRGLVGRDQSHPTAVPDGAMAVVRTVEATENAKRASGGSGVTVSAGDRVLIGPGAFEGLAGLCTKSRGERVLVLMTILGAAREVEMGVESVVRMAG